LIRRLKDKAQARQDAGVPVEFFSDFLKAKIDKKRDESELQKYARYMDIDKDEFISEIDIQISPDNLNSDAFFRNCGEALAVSAFSS